MNISFVERIVRFVFWGVFSVIGIFIVYAILVAMGTNTKGSGVNLGAIYVYGLVVVASDYCLTITKIKFLANDYHQYCIGVINQFITLCNSSCRWRIWRNVFHVFCLLVRHIKSHCVDKQYYCAYALCLVS